MLKVFKVSFLKKKSQKEAQIQILEKEVGEEENCSANMQNT